MEKYINKTNSRFGENKSFSENYTNDIFSKAAYDVEDEIADEELIAELERLAQLEKIAEALEELENEIQLLEVKREMKKKHKKFFIGIAVSAGIITAAAVTISHIFKKGG